MATHNTLTLCAELNSTRPTTHYIPKHTTCLRHRDAASEPSHASLYSSSISCTTVVLVECVPVATGLAKGESGDDTERERERERERNEREREQETKRQDPSIAVSRSFTNHISDRCTSR